MLAYPPFQIRKDRERRFDTLIHKPYLERSEAEHFLCYYLLKNIGITAYYCLGVELLPYQEAIMRILFRKANPMLILTRGGGKTFLLGVYVALRLLLTPGSKIVCVGANRRQAMFVFSEMAKLYYSKSGGLFRESCVKAPITQPDESYVLVKTENKESRASFYPLAQSDKIRGARSTVLITDECNLISEDVYKTILQPMGSVSASPVDKVKRQQREKMLIEAGVIGEEEATEFSSNQSIMSSSAGYQFQFFYRQYCDYKKEINRAITEERKDCPYAIVQMGWSAVEHLAPGYLDMNNIETARTTFSKDKFGTEYDAQFVSDSQGFFPRSLLESRTVVRDTLPSVEIAPEKDSQYILAIDPSSGENLTNDYFGIGVGKLDMVNKTITMVNAHGETGKGWTHYARTVRDYIRIFKPKYIVMDQFGGGSNLASLLQAEEFIQKDKGDQPLLPMEKNDLTTYDPALNRILRLVVFNPEWIEQANIHLKSWLDHSKFWFCSPPLNSAYNSTKEIADAYDTADEAILETKNELSMIIGEQNDKGMTIFKLPESVATPGKKRPRLRKDMYTVSLLLSWGAKEYLEILEGIQKKTKNYEPAFRTV